MAFFYLVVVVLVRCDGCAEKQCRCGNCGGPDLHVVVCLLKPDRDSTGSKREVVQERTGAGSGGSKVREAFGSASLGERGGAVSEGVVHLHREGAFMHDSGCLRERKARPSLASATSG
jgi:hypothetical protein